MALTGETVNGVLIPGYREYRKNAVKKNYFDPLQDAVGDVAKMSGNKTISKAADAELTTTDIDGYGTVLLKVDTTSADVTITFPPAADIANVTFPYKKIAGSNALILDANGSEEINGALTISTSDQGHVYSDGTALWAVLGA